MANTIASTIALGEGLEERLFDYEEAGVSSESRQELDKIVSRVKDTRRRILANVIEGGESLIRAKALVGHGNVALWVQAECMISMRTATGWMAVAHHFGGNRQPLADLNVDAAIYLRPNQRPPIVDPISYPLVGMVIAWATILFFAYGLQSKRHPMTILTIAVGAVAVASATYLILDFSDPYSGLFSLSQAPIQDVLKVLP